MPRRMNEVLRPAADNRDRQNFRVGRKSPTRRCACIGRGPIPLPIVQSRWTDSCRNEDGVIPVAERSPHGVTPGSAHREVQLGPGVPQIGAPITIRHGTVCQSAATGAPHERSPGEARHTGQVGRTHPDSGRLHVKDQRILVSSRRHRAGGSGNQAAAPLSVATLDSHRVGVPPALWESGSAVGVYGGPGAGSGAIPGSSPGIASTPDAWIRQATEPSGRLMQHRSGRQPCALPGADRRYRHTCGRSRECDCAGGVAGKRTAGHASRNWTTSAGSTRGWAADWLAPTLRWTTAP